MVQSISFHVAFAAVGLRGTTLYEGGCAAVLIHILLEECWSRLTLPRPSRDAADGIGSQTGHGRKSVVCEERNASMILIDCAERNMM